MTTWLDALAQLRAQRRAGVLVTLLEVRGHAPRDAGTKMVVADDATWGTVGGGNLEATAVERARAVIARGGLGPTRFAVGLSEHAPYGHGRQCCGGEVEVLLEPVPVVPAVAVFGVGHVGLELARVLARQDLDLHLVDSREEAVAPARLRVLDDAVARVESPPRTASRAGPRLAPPRHARPGPHPRPRRGPRARRRRPARRPPRLARPHRLLGQVGPLPPPPPRGRARPGRARRGDHAHRPPGPPGQGPGHHRRRRGGRPAPAARDDGRGRGGAPRGTRSDGEPAPGRVNRTRRLGLGPGGVSCSVDGLRRARSVRPGRASGRPRWPARPGRSRPHRSRGRGSWPPPPPR